MNNRKTFRGERPKPKSQTNMETKPTIEISTAEEMVCLMADGEQIEDRVYEMAQGLVNQYIGKVEANLEIAGLDELGSGEEWYDEAREEAMKIIFEKLSEFFRQ